MHTCIAYTHFAVVLCLVLLKCTSCLLLSRVGNYEIVRSEFALQKTINKRVSELGGYKTWTWRGNQINYINNGVKKSPKSPLLLIHGLVAPSFHWRDNMPELAKKYDVYAMDLLGMGLSDKPLTKNFEYGEPLWRDQVLDFIQQVIAKDNVCTKNGQQIPCVLAGTGIGGAIALAAATSSVAIENDLISGLVLLNSQSHFRMPPKALPRHHGDATQVQMLRRDLWQEYRSAVFIYKQYLRGKVYPVHAARADDVLMECIRQQMEHSNAEPVWQNIVETGGKGSEAFTDDCLAKLKVPLMLIWGTQDTWLKPPVADRIQRLYPQALRVNINAGHCVHDETPQPVNQAMDIFLQGIEDARLKQTERRNINVDSSQETDTREVTVKVREKIATLQRQIQHSETAAEAHTDLLLSVLNVVERTNEVVLQVTKYNYMLSKAQVNTESPVESKSNDWLQLAWEGLEVAEQGEKIFRLAWASNVDRTSLVKNIEEHVSKLDAYVGKVLFMVEKAGKVDSGAHGESAGSDSAKSEIDISDTGDEVNDETNSNTARVDTSLDEMKRILQTGEEVAQSLIDEGSESDDEFLDEQSLHVEMLQCVRVAQGLVGYAHHFLENLKL